MHRLSLLLTYLVSLDVIDLTSFGLGMRTQPFFRMFPRHSPDSSLRFTRVYITSGWRLFTIKCVDINQMARSFIPFRHFCLFAIGIAIVSITRVRFLLEYRH